jgi:FtsZ-binding cell division protein ZapB
MNKEACEKVICILLGQIEEMQQELDTRRTLLSNFRHAIDALKQENETLLNRQPERREPAILRRKVGRPKGSKNKPKVAA